MSNTIKAFVKQCILSMVQKQPSENEDQVEFELEIRFQHVTGSEFNRLMTYMQNLPIPTYYDETVDYFYANNVRVIKWPRSNKEICLQKNILSQVHVPEKDVKVTWAKEMNLGRHANYHTVQLIRRKYRTSFQMQNLLLQLTRVVNEATGSVHHEIEIEIWDVKRSFTFARIDHLLNQIEKITFRDSKTSQQHTFRGALPKTLDMHDISRLQNEKFAATLKMDGSRALVLLNDTGMIQCTTRDGSILGLENQKFMTTNFVNCMFDAEYNESDKIFYLYDTIMFNGIDCRSEEVVYTLPQRLKFLQDFVETVGHPFHAKTHWLHHEWTWPIIQQWASTMKEGEANDSGIDGIIFTKEEMGYPRQSRTNDILKWKPRHLQSIDFQISKSAGLQHHMNHWTLSVLTQDKLIPFPHCPSIKVDKEISDRFENHSIVECVYQSATHSFVPQRTRFDKTKPNYITTANDVWSAVCSPVLPSMFDCCSTQIPKWQMLRRLHGQIKRSLLSLILEFLICEAEPHSVLDIACGRGGDLHSLKSYQSSIQSYIGSDINENNLREARHRFQEHITDPHFSYEFHLADWRQDLRQHEMLSIAKKYLVSVQFAIHFFFESPLSWTHFIQNINQATVIGSYLIATVFDADQVRHHMQGQTVLHKMDANGAHYSLQLNKPLSQDEFGSRLSVGMFGDHQTLLKEPSQEYLVHMSDLIYLMVKSGWSLVDSALFTCPELQNSNFFSDFSRLNRYYVFQKKFTC